MAPYRYIKRIAVAPRAKVKPKKINSKIIAVIIVIIGVFFLANAAYPIIFYQLFVSPRFASSFISPTTDWAIAQSFSPNDDSFVDPSAGSSGALGTEIDLLDLTKASNWFPKSKETSGNINNQSAKEVLSYFLSIPKLKIDNALVIDSGEDLKKYLVQFPGTAAPGRFGNTVIFGHSVLPQFFNPKNYISIFSTLPTLKPNDEIIINYNEVQYKYIIEKMIEVTPNDISILAQKYDDSYLTLITCVPPGTYLKRLIVRARLVKI